MDSNEKPTTRLIAARVLSHENEAEYERVLEVYQSLYLPASEHENFLVSQMAQAQWKVTRILRLLAIAVHDVIPEGKVDQGPDARIVSYMRERSADVMALLHRWVVAAEKSYHRAQRELRRGRTRKASKRALRKLPVGDLGDFAPRA